MIATSRRSYVMRGRVAACIDYVRFVEINASTLRLGLGLHQSVLTIVWIRVTRLTHKTAMRT